ncbi:DUF4377 domain-containing protein [Acinetobacter sp. WZC-1]|uniref:DUF4377 domain-containing protein n=1 Tax=Acinetobacter sp. WZC-1 TaxID=3459034 RepID=UPI00403E2906
MYKIVAMILMPLAGLGCSTVQQHNDPSAINASDGKTIYLEVAAHTQLCPGMAQQFECLQVREVSYDQQGHKVIKNPEWHNFYNEIEGYTHRPSEQALLKLKMYEIAHPAADGSSVRYVFDQYVERKQSR